LKKQSLIVGLMVFLLAVFVAPVVLADGPVEGRAGRSEVRFMEGMIDHHQMAVDMANDCLSKASSENLKTLCQDIIDAQTAEIAQLQEWLLNWYNIQYEPMPMMNMMEMMDGMGMGDMDHGGMEGMPHTDPPMMMGMMAGLNRLEGVEYDVAWAESMIDHHDDAIHMSERLLGRVSEGEGHAELLGMAQQIIDDQTAEIAELENILVELGE
jgi:uncharacterized protein (DUF305 family)